MSQKIKSYDGALVREPRPTEFVDAAPMGGQRAGRWYPPGGSETLTPVEAQPYLVPVVIHRRRTIQRIGCAVTTAGGAGALVRMGIYSDADGTPQTRIWDAGAVNATSSGGKLIVAPETLILDPGQYWLAVVVQGGATPVPEFQATSVPNPLVGLVTGLADIGGAGYRVPSTMNGALAPAFSLTNVVVAPTVPNVHIQF